MVPSTMCPRMCVVISLVLAAEYNGTTVITGELVVYQNS